MIFFNHQGFFIAVALLYLLTIPSVSSFQKNDLWEDSYKFTTYHPGKNFNGLSNIKSYFHTLGYIPNVPPSNFDDNFDDSLISAIKTYQNMYKLNPTGKLDHNTLRLLMTPRCGVPDIIKTSSFGSYNSNTHSIHTVSHFDYINGNRWPVGTTELTYAFNPQNQLNDTFKTAIKNGIERWTPSVKITFQENTSYSTSIIKISFENDLDHGDGHPFIPNAFAHAFYPIAKNKGMFHFYNQYTWVASGDVTKRTEPKAVDLESVTVHEAGHLLGLSHSEKRQAIMFPYLSFHTRKVDLTEDDIDGIQGLYGIKEHD